MTSSMESKVSPMMAQWHECKQNAKGALLLFRLGDFYEAFYEDAILLSKELELTLTKRQEIPMAGMPFHSSESYIDKLISKGFKVAIAEQIEDPKLVKGLVKREIVRIVTPGTVITSSLLSEKSNNFLACLCFLNKTFGLAILDLTTAEFRVLELYQESEILDELCRLEPKELIISEKCSSSFPSFIEEVRKSFSVLCSTKEEWHFDHQCTHDFLIKHFGVHSLDGFGLKGMISAINAAGALLSYVQDDLNFSIDHIKTIRPHVLNEYMALDRATQRHLELTESLHEKESTHTLLHLLDKTSTPMGARLLKQWLLHPLLSSFEIKKRQEAIQCLVQDPLLLKKIKTEMSEIRDLERLIMRIQTGYCSPRDLIGLKLSLEKIPIVSSILSSLDSEFLQEKLQVFFDVSNIVSKIQISIVDEPPFRLSDGNIFKKGYHKDLDELKDIQSNSHEWAAKYQAKLKDETQIKTLKVGYTKAFGYYIEVSRGQANRIPENFERKQTLVSSERFITPELKEFEYKILSAEEKISQIENLLFQELRQEISSYSSSIKKIADSISCIDCIVSLAAVAKEYSWTCPLVDESDVFEVIEGRHPVIQAYLKGETFIPNDVHMNASDKRLHLITGPNMAGKSTFIRQVALIAILAQIGSFVPAKKTHIGMIDKVFSRIGASDNLSRGQSTFMVEMTETANILNNATSRSLVILDEIGRGTSTYDGISIAWAVAEYLLTTKDRSPKTLFATHYCELIELEGKIPGALNFNVAVHESEKGIVFLRKILPGGTDKSYGIHVARLAGLPSRVIHRSKEILKSLEEKHQKRGFSSSSQKPSQDKEMQLSFFTHAPVDLKKEAILEEIKAIDPNYLTPIEALRKLNEWKEKLLSK